MNNRNKFPVDYDMVQQYSSIIQLHHYLHTNEKKYIPLIHNMYNNINM